MRAVCVAAKWGSEATLALNRSILHPLLLALGCSHPAWGCQTVGIPVVGAAALTNSKPNRKPCQRWWELGTWGWWQPRSPGGQRWDFCGGRHGNVQARRCPQPRAGHGMVLKCCISVSCWILIKYFPHQPPTVCLGQSPHFPSSYWTLVLSPSSNKPPTLLYSNWLKNLSLIETVKLWALDWVENHWLYISLEADISLL